MPQEDRDNLPILEANIKSQEKDAWYWYFANHLGWVPAAFQSMMIGNTKAFTVPTQWPEWFDLNYQPPDSVPSAPRGMDIPYQKSNVIEWHKPE